MSRSKLFASAVAAVALALPGRAAAQRAVPAATAASAPISNVRYALTFDSSTASQQTIGVTMTFTVASTAPVLLSLPSWTPGAYEVSNFARKLSGFSATGADSAEYRWDKLD